MPTPQLQSKKQIILEKNSFKIWLDSIHSSENISSDQISPSKSKEIINLIFSSFLSSLSKTPKRKSRTKKTKKAFQIFYIFTAADLYKPIKYDMKNLKKLKDDMKKKTKNSFRNKIESFSKHFRTIRT